MLIQEIAFGDAKEAFIEKRLTSGLNLIFSDDNNRGKTLVMQGLMYSLGYQAIFPNSFKYKEKFFYSKISVDEKEYEFLRKKDFMVIKGEGFLQACSSIEEAKLFIDKFVFSVPKIFKDARLTSVDLTLLYEMFFIGQDGRNSSSLISRGRFNKIDFQEMLLSYVGLNVDIEESESQDNIKSKISTAKQKIKNLKKKIDIIGKDPSVAAVTSLSYDEDKVQEKRTKITELNNEISKLRRSRLREMNRVSKLTVLIIELNSLNRELQVGEVKCSECGSNKIIYSAEDVAFEISNLDIRHRILQSIHSSIQMKEEIIANHGVTINKLKQKLVEEMNDTPPDFQQLMLYQEYIISDQDNDLELKRLQDELNKCKRNLESKSILSADLKSKRKGFLSSIVTEMNRLYALIDASDNITFDGVFTKRDENYSGSEGQEYYFCKIIALSNALNHDFPIIVDSFRDGEISTDKESKMLEIYGALNKQVILTSTLKNEEYAENKYNDIDGANLIDYSNHDDCEIMKRKYAKEFLNVLSRFDIVLEYKNMRSE